MSIYPKFIGPLPADHPLRDEREPINYIAFRCEVCRHPWTVVAIEGEPPLDYSICHRCGGDGRRMRP